MQQEIEKIKDRLVNKLLIISLLFLSFALAGSLSRWFDIGFHPSYVFHVLLFSLLFFCTLYRKHLSLRSKVHSLGTIYLAVSIVELYFLAHYSGYFFILISVSIVAITLGRRLAYFYAVLFLVFYIISGWLYLTDKITTLPDLNSYSRLPFIWINIFFTFLTLLIISIEGFGMFYKELVTSVKLKIEARNELQRSEAFRSHIFDSSRLPIVVMDAQTFRFIDCNNAAVSVYGHTSKAQVLGLTPLDVSAPMQYDRSDSLEKALFYIEKAKKYGSIVFEWRHQRPDGVVWDAEVHLLYFTLDNKALLQFSSVDITERKKAEEKLLAAKNCAEENKEAMQKLYYELQVSEEETRAANEDLLSTTDTLRENINLLEKAKLKAEESDKLKTAFLQNISHEVRTPLNAICGFSQILSNQNHSNEDQKAFIDIIQNSSIQLLSIVSDIITISSIETGALEPNYSNVCINSLFDEVKAVFDNQIGEKQMDLKAFKNLPDKEAEILTDKIKLTQILNNLIANAIKFTHKGVIEVGYTLNINVLEFYVKDSGIGIDKSKHNVIFERFRQAEDNTHADYGGTGLGLSICKGFVELLNGRIWVESELGKGATFYFTIPYMHPEEVSKRSVYFLGSNVEKNLWARKTVLVAEDEEYNYAYLDSVLKKFNCNIIHARNGQQAADFCNENQNINLVLMDIKMPVMDGHTAAKIIKERKPSLPIVAQTAYALASEVENYQGVFNDYITKPISIEKLKVVLETYMNA